VVDVPDAKQIGFTEFFGQFRWMLVNFQGKSVAKAECVAAGVVTKSWDET